MKKLDFGCGNGGFPGGYGVHPRERGSWLLAHGDADTLALDRDPSAIREARVRITNDTRFIIADGRKLPFKNQAFDYVREWGVLHHIPEYTTALDEIARVLKRGGRLEAFETVDDDPFYAVARTLVGNWKGIKIESRYKSGELIEYFEKHFNVNSIEYWYSPLILDVPSYFFETYPGWVAGLYFRYYGSKLRRKLGILPRFARHVTITAVRR